MKKFNSSYLVFAVIIVLLQSCVSRPPDNPDNICLIFKEKKSWYKATIRAEKRWKIPINHRQNTRNLIEMES